MTDKEREFLEGVAISAACACLPVRKVYADRLDNEWPIEWKASEVKNNKTYINSTMTFRRISSAVGYDYENCAAAVTMVGDGFTETFTTKNIGVTEQTLGKLIYIRCTLSGTTFILALLVIETPGTEGVVEFTETGTYYAFLNSSYINVEINNADLQFELTAPQPTSYSYNGVILPALPEWDRERYPYAVIATTWIDHYYHIIASEKPLYVGTESDTDTNGWITYPGSCNVIHLRCYEFSDEWTYMGADTYNGVKTYLTEWSNYDMTECRYDNSSGSYVYTVTDKIMFRSSEPVPVYE